MKVRARVTQLIATKRTQLIISQQFGVDVLEKYILYDMSF